MGRAPASPHPPDASLARALAIPGWMREAELRWLAEHARPARVIVEIGSFLGRSTRALGDHTAGVVYAIDFWNGGVGDAGSFDLTWADVQREFTRHLEDLIERGTVMPLPHTAATALDDLRALGVRQADLVFIDGDHHYPAVCRDIRTARALLARGGILSGHDYGQPWLPDVKRAVDELVGAVQLCDSIWWTEVWR